jgi:Na+/pantothenate symporter
MGLNVFGICVFLLFTGFVVGFSMYKSRREETGEEFFLASRGLTWPLIGFSLIAANISTEQFVGMNGQAAGDVGLAGKLASLDRLASLFGEMAFLNKMAITLVVIVLPMFAITVSKPLREPKQMPVKQEFEPLYFTLFSGERNGFAYT